MKKVIFLLIVANLFYSCQNLNQGLNRRPAKVITSTSNVKLQQEDFLLTDTGLAYFLEIISANSKNNNTRSYSEGNTFDLYLGEKFELKTNLKEFEIATMPNIKTQGIAYEAVISGGSFQFRSFYQGTYSFVLKSVTGSTKTIVINNKSPYIISSFDLKNLVTANASERNFAKVQNSTQVFKMLFPESERLKEVSFILANQLYSPEGVQPISREVSYIEEMFELTDDEKINLIQIKEKVLNNNSYFLNSKYLTYEENSAKLNQVVATNIIKRGKPNEEELAFLEVYYGNAPSKELATRIGRFFYEAGETSKGSHYSNVNSSILPTSLRTKSLGMELKEKAEILALSGASTSVEMLSSNEITTSNEITNSLDVNYRKGVEYYKAESYAEAILLLEKAKLVEDTSVINNDLYYYLGNSYYLTNNFNNAKDNFINVSPSNKNYLESMYKLGNIYVLLKDDQKAFEAFTLVKENGGNSIWARRSIINLSKINKI